MTIYLWDIMKIPKSRYFKFRLRLRAFIYKVCYRYWYKRYQLNTVYNNYLANNYPKLWEAESWHFRSFRHRWQMHKLLGIEFKFFVKEVRHKYLFMLCNWWISAFEYYGNRLYYTNKAIKRWG